MSDKFEIQDFKDLVISLKPSLETHDVPGEMHFSLLSDIAFHVANLVDEKTGSNFHEVIDGLMDDISEEISSGACSDYCVAFLELVTEKGKKHETNVLKSMLEIDEAMVSNIEFVLELRDILEIDEEIDIDKRLKSHDRKHGKVTILRFQKLSDMNTDIWEEVILKESSYGKYESNVSGIKNCIHSVVEKWV